MSASTSSSEFAACMCAVARELLGEPNRVLSSRDEWRYGERGSLKIDVKAGTFCDFESGAAGGVIDFVSSQTRTDKAAALAWLAARKHLPEQRPSKPKSRIVKTYDYCDEAGALAFQVCRFEPKDFRQRRPNGSGGWIWKMDGVQRVPYRLPDVIAAVENREVIYIAEGEKGADALASIGVVGTCSPGGANKWRKEYNRFFTGADAVILPDNDQPGQDHAADVAQHLIGVAARVRMLMLPNLPLKGDIADWLQAGGTAEQLAALAALCEPVVATERVRTNGHDHADAHQASDPPDDGQDERPEPEPADEPQQRKRQSNRSRAAIAFRKGRDLRRGGATFDEMVAALATDPATADWTRAKGQAANQLELHRIWDKAAEQGPVIRVEAGRLHKIATESEDALIAAELPIFQRGRTLVQPISMDVAASRGRVTRSACLGSLNPHSLVDAMCATAEYVRYDARSEDWLRTDPPGQVARILLSREGRWRFPVISGVVTTPTLRPDGSLLLAPGYDAATRLYHIADPSLKMPPIADKPTKDEAFQSLTLLRQLLVEFEFVNEVSRAVGFSTLITPVVRAALLVAPLHLIRAHQPGSGKSFLADTANSIIAGRPCPVVRATDDPIELEKGLSSLLLAGLPLISLDNINGELGSNLLCQAVERPIVQIRQFGTLETVEVASTATFLATGNNSSLRGDVVRRGLISDLDPGLERPELRQYKGNPVEEILANRGLYVAACLTIVKAYIEAGMPDKPPALASFEDWSDLVRGSLMWLGCDDPLASMEASRSEDPDLLELKEVLAVLEAQFGTMMITAATIAQRTVERKKDEYGQLGDYMYPDFRDFILRQFGERGEVNTRKVGNWLRSKEGRIIDKHRLKRVAEVASGGRTQWKIEPAKQ